MDGLYEQPGDERSKRCFHHSGQQPGVPDVNARPGAVFPSQNARGLLVQEKLLWQNVLRNGSRHLPCGPQNERDLSEETLSFRKIVA
jgi:hypothetical protein